ncbi:alpha/beta hydrolase [Actinoplanes sp. NPDC049316]|uniref:alpha/beta fold hydrolase n=1 Tax=Actinoplanes sp. NPDC049316 TaxID=3154727 RepID=UPI00342F2DD7
MTTARLHDDSVLDVTILGDGPALLLPVSMHVPDGDTAEQMRAWGADPALGRTLTTALADAGLRVIAADYEGHRAAHPAQPSLTAANVAKDLLAIADAAGAERFAYYGYSWLALAGLQLALRTDRLAALAMGGFPPLGGPYEPMLTVTAATYRMAVANRDNPPPPATDVQPGDWDATEVTMSPEQAGQYLTLYESLRGFDERAALDRIDVPRLAFAGENDDIQYGERWDRAYVGLADGLKQHRDELTGRGWTVEIVPGADHIVAMQARTVLPILTPWLTAHAA